MSGNIVVVDENNSSINNFRNIYFSDPDGDVKGSIIVDDMGDEFCIASGDSALSLASLDMRTSDKMHKLYFPDTSESEGMPEYEWTLPSRSGAIAITEDYYTKSEVDKKIANAGSGDLSNYYTKTEVDNKK